MATIAFSLAGQSIGGLIGGPIGATIGRAVGAVAGSALDNVIFGDKKEPNVPANIRLQGSMQGVPISKIYGWNRVSGNIIWATELEKISSTSSGAKSSGSSSEKNEQIVANFAIALCEGEVNYLGRIWADGEILETEGLNIRFYKGSADQLADSLIVAKQGQDRAPAYRDICYLVFERFPLAPFGNRIPNISVELCRSVGDLENSLQAITIIPGASEFGYEPEPKVRIISPGTTASENAHIYAHKSDWTVSIDELVALCPNLKHVALIISWFGDDLRCGECKIQPRVENNNRNIEGDRWEVNGLLRQDVPVVTQNEGAPAYGGTPSDKAVLNAIADLHARGLKVTIYPLIMMDIASNNSLLDPYTQNLGQPAYPWRGRITCNPAIGVSGSPDKTNSVIAQIDAFVGNAQISDFTISNSSVIYNGPNEWSYRRMILHYAKLVEIAGGVDAFIIGSEMRAMTQIRSDIEQFPFVDALVELAQDVRTILGNNTKISYAADWSEYSGYQPEDSSGDKYFHLDELWASNAIDAIGIDNYMPIADWRDGDNHLDAELTNSCREISYLQSNINGGEGYDYYYASFNDREAQNRTPISDGAHNEDWIWRYKDLYNWWNNYHYNRIGGERKSTPTAWIAQSKPFWFTELGCGAVDKGSNLPSAFYDPKSAENALPYFSSGAPDPLQQRQHIRAHHHYWQPQGNNFTANNNPISNIYGGYMLDPERIYVWTWDARAYPAFPNFLEIWADGENYKTGHWLTGRLGGAGAAELIRAMGADFAIDIKADIAGNLLINGVQINNIASLRSAITPILDASNLEIIDRPTGLELCYITNSAIINIAKKDIAQLNGEYLSRKQPDSLTNIGQLSLNYYERQNNYASATISAISLKGDGIVTQNSNLTINSAEAARSAENALARLNIAEDIVNFALPVSFLALEVGDVINIEGQLNGPFIITEIGDCDLRKITARAIYKPSSYSLKENKISASYSPASFKAVPIVIATHFPAKSDGSTNSRILFAAFSNPWPGEIIIKDQLSNLELARLESAANIGVVNSPISSANSHIWDNANILEIELYNGSLSSADKLSVLANSNRIAVERDDGSFEIIGFVNAELIANNIYRVSKLLRGLLGTDNSISPISVGNRVVILDQNVHYFDVPLDILGTNINAIYYIGANDGLGHEININIGLNEVKPLKPVHLRAKKIVSADDIEISWIRRARVSGNSWVLSEVPLEFVPEKYRLNIYNNAQIVRSLEVAENYFLYNSAMQLEDFGVLPANFNFEIAQISPTLGEGHFASGNFSL